MAYRQLCAVTFATLGWLAVACGGNTGTNAAPDATEEQPPSNQDQAPNDTDTASNPDQTPGNTDAPPSNVDDPAGSGGGGRLTALCERICDTIETLAEDCSDGMTDIGMGEACKAPVNCQIPVDTPCVDEIADAFDCIFENLATICSDAPGEGQQGPQAKPCQDVGRRFTMCAEQNGLTDPDPGEGNGNGNQRDCTEAGGCECPTECATCSCEAGSDLEELQACATGACAQQ